jgi:hypothetical protein
MTKRKMNRDELIKAWEELAPEIEKLGRQFGIHEPDWAPLKIVFGPFMFMGYFGGIRMYKHKYTRRYLNLDEQGRAYRYLAHEERYERIPLEDGIALAFDEAETCFYFDRDDADDQQSRGEGDVWGG